MARIRSLHPGFWTDEKVVTLSLAARLLFMGIWTYADDAGRIEAKPGQLKLLVFPGDPCTKQDVAGWLGELETAGLLQRYEVEGTSYLHCTNWARYQLPRYPLLRFPAPPCAPSVALPQSSRKAPVVVPQDSRNPTVVIPPNVNVEDDVNVNVNVNVNVEDEGGLGGTPAAADPEWLGVLRDGGLLNRANINLLRSWASRHDSLILLETAHALAQKWPTLPKGKYKSGAGAFQGGVRVAEQRAKASSASSGPPRRIYKTLDEGSVESNQTGYHDATTD